MLCRLARTIYRVFITEAPLRPAASLMREQQYLTHGFGCINGFNAQVG